MKTKLYVLLSALILCVSIATIYMVKDDQKEEAQNDYLALVTEEATMEEQTIEEVDPIIYDGLTREELIAKINRSLNSTIANQGQLYVDYSLKLGVDPYLAVAITLHETGCKWECSQLVKKCNNVGGQKGKPSCGGGDYKSYATLEEGIRGYIANLYNNYIKLGLTTPEQIGPKYAASTTWASKINQYIQEIKAK